jgi:hypothetical protein
LANFKHADAVPTSSASSACDRANTLGSSAAAAGETAAAEPPCAEEEEEEEEEEVVVVVVVVVVDLSRKGRSGGEQ